MNSRVKSALDKVIQAFKDEKIPRAIAYQKFPVFNIPCQKWSFLNQIMVAINDTEDARGYKQWQSVNRHVKKGAKGFDILVPCFKKKEDEEEEEKILYGFMCSKVFRFEDTEGESLEYERIELPELPLLDKAKSWGIEVKAISGNESFYGMFIPSRNEIKLATPEEKTFFHELSHYAHSKIITLKSEQNPWQEIVAELSAQTLCRIVGKTSESQLGNSYEYISYYSKKLNLSPYNSVLQVIHQVEQVLNYILEAENGNDRRNDSSQVQELPD